MQTHKQIIAYHPNYLYSACILGGEPLLYVDVIDKIVDYVGNRMRFHIVTNGSLIEKHQDWLINLRMKVDLKMIVSYDYAN